MENDNNVYDFYDKKKKRKTIKVLIWVLAIIAILICVGVLLSIYTDYIQIKEIGNQYTNVFWINFNVKVIAQIISFLAVFLIFFIPTLIIRKNILSIDSNIGFLKRTLPIVILSIIISIFASSLIRESVYSRFLTFANSLSFGKSDPIFKQDIGYYIFRRPFLIAIVDSIKGIWLLQTVYTVIVYFLLYANIALRNVNDIIHEKSIVVHNIINIVVYFLVKAATYKFKAEDILYSTIGNVSGAGYTDIKVWLSYYRVAPFLLIAIVIAALVFILRGKIKNTVITIVIFPVVSIIVSLIAAVVQGLVVSPNEVAIEEPYLKYNIEYTRNAYSLDNIIEKEFPIKNDLTLNDLAQNPQTINNIRITDFSATLKILNQIQTIRNFYRFYDTDIATYDINGVPTAVFLGAREMYQDNLEETAKTFINTKLRFTHGFGVVMNPVNKITVQGQPSFIIKDIPPKFYEGAPEVTQPRIYYGEQTNNYVIVNSKQKELDYSEGQNDVEFSYDGRGGINLEFFNKLIFSAKYGDIRMLVSGFITPESKLLLNRNVTDRARKIAPFFYYDDDPYIVISGDGRIKWIVDAYTYSSYYPYSQSAGNINYVRNSAKVVIDAYDGNVDFYITDKTDPIVNVYSKIYPTLFSKEELPLDIAEHIRYPEEMFKIQANVLKKYHITNPRALYDKSDMWDISKEKYVNERIYIEPYYNFMKLPGISDETGELVLMTPYTIFNRDNMVAWLAVRSEGDAYGQMVLYKFPKGVTVLGTMQMENIIDQDPDISREMTLWGQGGSSVIRGNMLVIPIKNSVLYVEPIYITANNESSLPEVKRIIMAYDNKIVMERTLEAAITALFGEKAEDVVVDVDDKETLIDIIERALDNFNDVKTYSKENDFENFGKALKQLDDTMGILDQKKDEIQ